MRVLIEGTTWWNRRGFGRFTRNLVKALVRRDDGIRYTLLVDRPFRDGDEIPPLEVLEVAASVPTHEAATAESHRRLADMLRSARAVRRGRFDLVFFPAVYSYFPLFPGERVVVTFHDAIAESLPRLVFDRFRHRLFWTLKVKAALRQADRLLAVSASAKDQVVAALGVDPARIGLVTEGPDPAFRHLDLPRVSGGAAERSGIPPGSRFLLYVGGISPHKNLLALVRAFEAARPPADLHLALAGDEQADGFLAGAGPIRAFLAARPALAARVHFTGFVPDEELAELYNRALAFVSPSLLEGFGLCQLEAMACGAPVLSSDRGSLPEVVGDAGLYFDPEDEAAIAVRIREIASEGALAAALSARALARSAHFSWDRAAALAVDAIREVGGRRP